jgi:hypothetical protein
LRIGVERPEAFADAARIVKQPLEKEEMPMDEAKQQSQAAKPTPKEVHDRIMAFGASDLDAGLVADCLNVGKSTTWMNNDPVAEDINERLAAFLKEHGYGFEITVTPVKMGKYIWDVKKNKSRE